MKYHPNNLKPLVSKLLELWWVSAYALMFHEHKSSLAHINREKVSKYFSTIHNAVNYSSKYTQNSLSGYSVFGVRGSGSCLWEPGRRMSVLVFLWTAPASELRGQSYAECLGPVTPRPSHLRPVNKNCLLFVVCRLKWGETFENGFASWYAPIENLSSPRNRASELWWRSRVRPAWESEMSCNNSVASNRFIARELKSGWR